MLYLQYGTQGTSCYPFLGKTSKPMNVPKSNYGGTRKMADKTLVCCDCNQEFVFTEGEREFLRERVWKDGVENEPKRCKPCGKAKKAKFRRPRPEGAEQAQSESAE